MDDIDILQVRDSNDHIKAYLDYYAKLDNPGYAILISGAWGIGKTFLIKKYLLSCTNLRRPSNSNTAKKFLRHRDTPEPFYLYVSLYGTQTLEQIDLAILRELLPALNHKIARWAGKISSTAIKYIGLEFSFKASDILPDLSNCLLVFDDLERCSISISDILGYINKFIEHEGCKAIIVANEKEIENNNEYIHIKEKVIGKTLEVQSDPGEAFKFFVSNIQDNNAKELFTQRSKDILDIYEEGKIENLRILKYSLADFERIFKILDEKQQKNTASIAELLRLFMALSFEFKLGRIETSDLNKRVSLLVRGERHGEPKNRFGEARRRYHNVQLESSLLSDEVLIDILHKGFVQKAAVEAAISASGAFSPDTKEAAWRTVWHFMSRTDEECSAALEELERQFEAREVTVVGELLHIFALRLWLAENGILKKNLAEVRAECESYIDELYTQKRLPPLPIGMHRDEFASGGYGGLGFHCSQSAEFRYLFDKVALSRLRAKQDKYSFLGITLLEELKSNSDLFYRRVCITNSSDNIYVNEPILASIDINDFVGVLISLHPSDQGTVFRALEARYTQNNLCHLTAERPWLLSLHDALNTASAQLPSLSQFRIQRLTKWHLIPSIEATEGGAGPA